jgi:hypothetical protein
MGSVGSLTTNAARAHGAMNRLGLTFALYYLYLLYITHRFKRYAQVDNL